MDDPVEVIVMATSVNQNQKVPICCFFLADFKFQFMLNRLSLLIPNRNMLGLGIIGLINATDDYSLQVLLQQGETTTSATLIEYLHR